MNIILVVANKYYKTLLRNGMITMMDETYDKDITPYLQKLINPYHSLLDVGSGLCQQLHLFECSLIIALEIHRPYLENRKNKLPHIIPICDDAFNMDRLFMKKTISTVLFNDSIEHFDKKDALNLLETAEKIAQNRVIVFTPRGFFHQENYDFFELGGEHYQSHRSGWEVDDFINRGYTVTLFKEFHDNRNPSFIMSYGEDHPSIDAILAWKDLNSENAKADNNEMSSPGHQIGDNNE
ncbi:hypothetical protein SAMN05444487_106139 [Marininema mesophilum]|uniref:Methyltransferase domain-containing protein n=1 Tax=Marininema mesophilum TaxID=1048340 RepID=A0A1H2WHP2_9BACL|nr:hypothetical protein [Marininema mesophilum]SDW80183.1 hypothetical protein SAMN05444487_106139 [Marininema mesophilum]